MEGSVRVRHQIHTVLLTASKRQGLAMGIDIETRKIFCLWLLNDRAVALAMRRLEATAQACLTTPKKITSEAGRHRLGYMRSDREWSLQ